MTNSQLFICVALPWLLMPLMACSAEHWTDEVQLHDGRSIDVERTVSMTTQVSIGEGRLFTKTPTIYGLNFKNPTTGEKISWRSEHQYVLPVLLDFDGPVTYLAILLPRAKETSLAYGCPWPPYVFYRHDQNREWQRIPAADAPQFLRKANLSRIYDSFYMKRDTPGKSVGYQTISHIASRNGTEERQYDYYFQINIPRNRDDWKFKQQPPNCELMR